MPFFFFFLIIENLEHRAVSCKAEAFLFLSLQNFIFENNPQFFFPGINDMVVPITLAELYIGRQTGF